MAFQFMSKSGGNREEFGCKSGGFTPDLLFPKSELTKMRWPNPYIPKQASKLTFNSQHGCLFE